MNPREQLLHHALQNRYEGKRVISVDYVIQCLLDDREFKPPDSPVVPHRDVLKGIDVQTYQTMVERL